MLKEIPRLETRKPRLIMSVDGMESQKLDEADLRNLFGVFGDIKELQLLEGCQAEVEFTTLLQAFIARQQLNGKYIKSINSMLNIEWVNPDRDMT